MWPEIGEPLSLSPVGIVAIVLMAFAASAAIARATLAWLAAIAERDRARIEDHIGVFEPEFAPPVSILTRALDEQEGVVDRLKMLLSLRYPSLEVIVVNDGSSDGTLNVLIHAFGLRPVRRTRRSPLSSTRVRGVYESPGRLGLVVVDSEPAGEAAALTTALAFARHPLALPVSAAETLEPDAIVRLAAPFYEDASVVGVSGVSRVGDARVHGVALPRGLFGRFESLESLRGLGAGRPGASASARLLAPHEPPCLVARDEALAAGGFRDDVTSPRFDLEQRLRSRARRGVRSSLRYVPTAVSWVMPASGIVALVRQRVDRTRAVAEALCRPAQGDAGPFQRVRRGFELFAFLVTEFAVPVIELAILLVLIAGFATRNADTAFIVIFIALALMGGTVPVLIGLAVERVACPRFVSREALETLAMDALFQVALYRPLATMWRVVGVAIALIAGRPKRAEAHAESAPGETAEQAA
jgi:hypothetical protein